MGLDDAPLAPHRSPPILAMDENLKAQLFPPLVVFNLTVGGYMLYRVFTTKNIDFGTMFTHLLIGAAVGLVLGGITFFVTRKK